MAYEPQGDHAGEAQQKKVRFDLSGIDSLLPPANRITQTDFHRQSSEPALYMPSVEQAASSHTASHAGL